jgi:hypothetical protein
MSEHARPSLRALLEAERECCARLRLVLDAERAAAAAFDYPALIACLKERESLQGEWTQAATARDAAVRAEGRPLAAIAAAEPALAEMLRTLRGETAALARAQRVNARLVSAALAEVTDLLDVVRRERPETRYDGRAKLTAPLRSAGGGWSA